MAAGSQQVMLKMPVQVTRSFADTRIADDEYVHVMGRVLSGTFTVTLAHYIPACPGETLPVPANINPASITGKMPYAYVLVDEISQANPHDDENWVVIDGMAVYNHDKGPAVWTFNREHYQRWGMYLAPSQALNPDARARAGRSERAIYF